MKIAILHHDLEFSEKRIAKIIKEKGHEYILIDIRNAKLDDFKDSDLVLNRVYASVANRDYPSIKKTLEFLIELEKNNIKCLNSYKTSMFDYDKYLSYIEMTKAGIRNPKTILIDEKKDLKETAKYLVEELGLPIIIKRNIGGRGKDISRASSIEEIIKDLEEKFKNSKEEKYFGGFIAQEFIKTVKDSDCRVGVINNKTLFSYGRSLIPSNSEDSWLASISSGSKKVDYEAEEEEKEMSEKTTKLIEAQFNELDVMFTKDGPVIIENNPTPNFSDSENGRRRIDFFVNEILKNEK